MGWALQEKACACRPTGHGCETTRPASAFHVLAGVRDLLASVLWRITCQENKIEIKIRSRALRQHLENGGKITSASVPVKKPIVPSDLISLTVEAKTKRCGGEVHLIVPPNSSVSREHPKVPLIKALARAHGWYEKVIQGKAFDMRSLARDAGLTERYVGKVFRCAFLAPDIVEAILAGRQPHDLNFEKLYHDIPLSWVEQREQLGFSPARSMARARPWVNRPWFQEFCLRKELRCMHR